MPSASLRPWTELEKGEAWSESHSRSSKPGLLHLLDDRLGIRDMSDYADNSLGFTDCHDRRQSIPEHGDILGHADEVFLLVLCMQVLLEVRI